jgi:hypothetical protein
MGYALRASLWLFKFDPVKFVGSASQHKFIPDEFVFQQRKKSNQKNALTSLPFGEHVPPTKLTESCLSQPKG